METIMRSTLTLIAVFTALTMAQAADDILINNFETNDYGDWKVTGEAFGDGPAHGTLPKQQKVRGYLGNSLVNTFRNGDMTTGTLTSPAFIIQRKYITFLIGGGGHRKTAIELLVNGKVVAHKSGPSDEYLQPAFFNVTTYANLSVQLRIIDQVTGGWGHVNIDQIMQSDTKPKIPKYNIGEASAPPYNPHKKPSDYTENYRGQFHFSPKSEWMNDINGLVYQNGTYHMLYQWGKKVRHGGYATSKDLLHWKDEGVALIPVGTFLPKDTINVSGDHVYSGSAVLVSGETAKKITGASKDAIVAIYTGTRVGTCLAWTNDHGRTWHNYPHNPVCNPAKRADPRDPHVFWHEPSKTWINAIYEHGTTFYGSKDLITWEKLSNIDFGYECPDIYELPLDGDKSNMKWVLQDANGSYIVGHFDGKTFAVEQDKKIMDVGPDFYAAQTFFRPNLPSEDLIQLAWLDHWNGGVGEKGWERNATFPVTLGLVTYEGKMLVTRTPIEGIKKLYTNTKTWKNVTLKEGENALADVKSKTFDLTAVFDLKGKTTGEIIFNIANVTLKYDIKKQKFYGMHFRKNKLKEDSGKRLKPNAKGILKIRMLIDWAQLELFSAGGVFSYSAHLPFTPNDNSVGLTIEGSDVKLVSMRLSKVKRIWPKK